MAYDLSRQITFTSDLSNIYKFSYFIQCVLYGSHRMATCRETFVLYRESSHRHIQDVFARTRERLIHTFL